jgi:hypothetical protein
MAQLGPKPQWWQSQLYGFSGLVKSTGMVTIIFSGFSIRAKGYAPTAACFPYFITMDPFCDRQNQQHGSREKEKA